MVNQHSRKRPVHHCACGDHAWAVLTRGYVTLVSQEDAEFVGRWSWSTLALPDGKLRAVRRENRRGKGAFYYLHREILGAPDGMVVDHRNADGLDNRRSNIRICTPAQNARNQRVQRRPKSVGLKGVYHDRERDRWQAYITVAGKRKMIGRFRTAVEAAMAYDRMAIEMHGDFARTNASLGLLPTQPR